MRSPRFGDIRTVEATRDIKRGEELFVDYGYSIDSAFQPRWWRRLMDFEMEYECMAEEVLMP